MALKEICAERKDIKKLVKECTSTKNKMKLSLEKLILKTQEIEIGQIEIEEIAEKETDKLK